MTPREHQLIYRIHYKMSNDELKISFKLRTLNSELRTFIFLPTLTFLSIPQNNDDRVI